MSNNENDPLESFRRFQHSIAAPFERIRRVIEPSFVAIQNSPLVEMIRQTQRIRDAIDPPTLRWMRESAEKWVEIARWYREAPEKLRIALDRSGWIPHPEIHPADLRAITTVFDADGAEAARDSIVAANLRLFDDPTFRSELGARWARSKRHRVLAEVLDAFERGHFFTTIPTALAQCEGLIAQVAGYKGNMKESKMRELALKHLPESPFLASSVPSLLDVLHSKFHHGDTIPMFSRHAVIHGGDFEYGTKENAVRVLVWLDVVVGMEVDTYEPEQIDESETTKPDEPDIPDERDMD